MADKLTQISGDLFDRYPWFDKSFCYSKFLSKKWVFFDFDDGCWRQNKLVTTLRCWLQFWSFWLSTSTIFYLCFTKIQKMSPTSKIGHQYPKIVINLKSPISLSSKVGDNSKISKWLFGSSIWYATVKNYKLYISFSNGPLVIDYYFSINSGLLIDGHSYW